LPEYGIETLNTWLAKAGLRSEPEAALVSGFCERAVAAGLPPAVICSKLHRGELPFLNTYRTMCRTPGPS
jgi:hypothetical protein